MLPTSRDFSDRLRSIEERWGVLDGFLLGLLFFIAVLLSSGFANRFLFALMKTYAPQLVVEGTLYDNTWIGGLTEPFSTKLWPLLFISVFGLTYGYYVLLVSLVFLAGVFYILGLLGHPIGATLKFTIITFSLIGLTTAEYMRSRSVSYPERAINHPWLFGAYCGFCVAISEFIWYTTVVGAPVLLRIPALALHTTTGVFVIGTWVAFRDAGHTANLRRGFGILIAITIHLGWNTWLVNQTWFIRMFH